MNEKEVFGSIDPVGICNVCKRKTWDAAEVGCTCLMPQPDGNRCGGTFISLAQPPADGER